MIPAQYVLTYFCQCSWTVTSGMQVCIIFEKYRKSRVLLHFWWIQWLYCRAVLGTTRTQNTWLFQGNWVHAHGSSTHFKPFPINEAWTHACTHVSLGKKALLWPLSIIHVFQVGNLFGKGELCLVRFQKAGFLMDKMLIPYRRNPHFAGSSWSTLRGILLLWSTTFLLCTWWNMFKWRMNPVDAVRAATADEDLEAIVDMHCVLPITVMNEFCLCCCQVANHRENCRDNLYGHATNQYRWACWLQVVHFFLAPGFTIPSRWIIMVWLREKK